MCHCSAAGASDPYWTRNLKLCLPSRPEDLGHPEAHGGQAGDLNDMWGWWCNPKVMKMKESAHLWVYSGFDLPCWALDPPVSLLCVPWEPNFQSVPWVEGQVLCPSCLGSVDLFGSRGLLGSSLP